jgi:uncharacterized membrane protein AbrB (regulator of aidB expression)
MRVDCHLVDAVVSLPLFNVKVRILRTFGQALVVTGFGSHFSAHKGSELHKCKVSRLLLLVLLLRLHI